MGCVDVLEGVEALKLAKAVAKLGGMIDKGCMRSADNNVAQLQFEGTADGLTAYVVDAFGRAYGSVHVRSSRDGEPFDGKWRDGFGAISPKRFAMIRSVFDADTRVEMRVDDSGMSFHVMHTASGTWYTFPLLEELDSDLMGMPLGVEVMSVPARMFVDALTYVTDLKPCGSGLPEPFHDIRMLRVGDRMVAESCDHYVGRRAFLDGVAPVDFHASMDSRAVHRVLPLIGLDGSVHVVMHGDYVMELRDDDGLSVYIHLHDFSNIVVKAAAKRFGSYVTVDAKRLGTVVRRMQRATKRKVKHGAAMVLAGDGVMTLADADGVTRMTVPCDGCGKFVASYDVLLNLLPRSGSVRIGFAVDATRVVSVEQSEPHTRAIAATGWLRDGDAKLVAEFDGFHVPAPVAESEPASEPDAKETKEPKMEPGIETKEKTMGKPKTEAKPKARKRVAKPRRKAAAKRVDAKDCERVAVKPNGGADMLVPVGKGWRDVPELVALGVKPRRFGRLHHRVAYVFVTSNRVVVAWKDGYQRGSDKDAEQRINAMQLGKAA